MKCSKVYDVAIIGSGIGGALLAALNAKKKIIVFEKDKNLGGCAGTFKRFGNYYNAGATTFMGYEEGHVIKKMFDHLGLYPNIKQSPVAIRIIQNETCIDRTSDFELFLAQIEKNYPNKNNRKFWETLKHFDEKFWKLKKAYYARKNFKDYCKSALFLSELLWTYNIKLFQSAKNFVENTLGEISPDYEDFINAQLLITVQSNYKSIPLLSMALGLSYPFHKVYYVNGGMGTIIDELLQGIEVHTKEQILHIYKEKKFYTLVSNKAEYRAHKVVLNSTVSQSQSLFKQENIKNYYHKFEESDQSAFVVYLTLKSKEEFLHHYQIILKKIIPNAISNTFFVSFSDKFDTKLSKNGYSLTISCHTKASFWTNLPLEAYDKEKNRTQDFIIESFLAHFKTLTSENIVNAFSATSKTFQHFAHRKNCGGNRLSFETFFKLPTPSTPFKGLYNVGDSLFTGQGWPGVALGVEMLNKELK